MSLEVLQTLARFLATRKLVEDGHEAMILDRLKGANDKLAALFGDWKLPFESQEAMLCQCLGFVPRRQALQGLWTPILPERPPNLRRFLATHDVLLVRPSEGRAVLATSDPLAADFREQLALIVGVPVELVYLPPEEIEAGRRHLGDALAELAAELPKAAAPRAAEKYDEQSGPVVQLVDLVIFEAIQRKASDIHIEPFEKHGLVRYRIDGVLVKAREYAIELHAAIASRIKLIAGMDIAERRIPQDGRIRYDAHDADVDLRVASIPTAYGETVVMRILQRSSVRVDLEKGGFRPDTLALFRRSLNAAQGIILVTGPTGSGKTTTLYGMVNELNTVDTKIFTIEDPIEYQMEGIVQIPVNSKVGLTFAAALRSALRQDPDIIMIGEIRDLETAEIAIKSALTGHLVLATVHTNSAPSTLTRLIDMGVEPYNLSATIQGVLAQRLCRRVCTLCARKVDVSPSVRNLFESNGETAPPQVLEEVGCDECLRTGFKGRLGVHEFLTLSENLRVAVNQKQPDTELERMARREGMKTLMQDGLLKVASLQTTVREVLRVMGGTLD